MLTIRTAPTQLVATGSAGRQVAWFAIAFLMMWYWVIFQMWADGERWAVVIFVLASAFPALLLGIPSRDTLVLDATARSVTMRRRTIYRRTEDTFPLSKMESVTHRVRRRKATEGSSYAILMLKCHDKSRDFGPPLSPERATEHVREINAWLVANRPRA